MRSKSRALLLLALGCGLVAAIGITQIVARRNAAPEVPTGDTRAIFVAMTDIGMGDLLTSQILKLEQWPKDKIPAGALSRIQDIEGRRTRTRLYAGEPILDNKLLGKGASQQGATALIPKGYRVVPVKVDLVSGGSSMILPGDRVDVMVHFVRDPGREIPETVTRTILQDIKVFAVNDVLELEKEKDGGKSIVAKTISLLVTPEQAAKLMLASQLGSVNLVMRSPEDDQQAPNSQAKPGELLGSTSKSQRAKEELALPEPKPVEVKQPAAPPAPDTWTMRIIKPGAVDAVSFEEENAKAGAGTPAGQWKPTANGGNPPAKTPAKGNAKAFGPVAQETPPSALPPQQPTQTQKRDKGN